MLSTRLRAWSRSPLLRFLLLGLLVFGVDRWTAGRADPEAVVVTEGQVARLSALWERQWRRPPTRAELERLVADHVREEVLYREALRLGLDRDDTIIRRRLAQKLAFLAQDRALPETPPEAELRAYFEDHRERYARPARLTLRQIPFTDAPSDAEARARAAAALEELRAAPSTPLASLGDASMLPRRVEAWSPRELAAEFGAGFADAVGTLDAGEWTGPVPSAFGVHLVRLESREAPRVPTFDEARREVGRDWLEAARAEADAAFHAQLLERYPVEIDVPGLTLPGPGP